MRGQTTVYKGNSFDYYVCPHRSPGLRLDPATRCDVRRLKQRSIEGWVWATLIKLAGEPERIQAELVHRREDAEKEQHLTLQAMVGLQSEIARLQRQKAELLELYLNRDQVGSLLTRQEYETKASQVAVEIRRLETQLLEMKENNSSELPTQEESDEAMRLLKAVYNAGQKAIFSEKRALLRLLGVQILYDGQTIEMTGAVPTQSIVLTKLLRDELTHDISSLQPQSEPSIGSQVAAEDNSTFEDHKHNKDCKQD